MTDYYFSLPHLMCSTLYNEGFTHVGYMGDPRYMVGWFVKKKKDIWLVSQKKCLLLLSYNKFYKISVSPKKNFLSEVLNFNTIKIIIIKYRPIIRKQILVFCN